MILLLAQSAALVSMPWVASRFSADVLHARPVVGNLLALFGFVVVQALLAWWAGVKMQDTAMRMIADGCTRLFDHLQSLPLDWHQDRRRGDVLALLTEDVERLGWFASATLSSLLPLLLTCIGALAMMLWIEPVIGLGVALLVPAAYLALKLVGRRLRPLGRAVADGYARRTALAEHTLSMLPVVKAFTGEPGESGRFRAHARDLRDLQVREARMQLLVGPLVRIAAAAIVLAMLWLGSREVLAGTLQASELIALLLYGLLLTQPVSELAGVYGQVQSAKGAAGRLQQAFAQAPEPDDGRRELAHLRGELRFDAVSFAYPGREPILRGLELHVAAGETVAITGANGAGKSTLAHLLLRFADPQSGRVLIDGIDLREFALPNLRAHIGLVAQNVLLFNATIAENIAYARPDATLADIERAARAARAHGFVQALPRGYDTVVGDEGARLSGGQKQRIALARALLKNPSILILDEATAMFDPDGEGEFIAHCRDLLATRTVLLITHRPASLALADRVLVLRDGRLVDAVPPAIAHRPAAAIGGAA